MHNGEILLETKVSEATSRQDGEEFDGVHGLHVSVLSEAVSTVLVRVENGGEAPVHVECLVVEALEDLAVDVGLKGILSVAGSGYGVGEGGGGGGGGVVGGGSGGGGGLDGADGGGNVPVGGAHEREEEGCEGF